MIKYAITMEHIKLYIDLLGVSYKTTNVVIKNIVFMNNNYLQITLINSLTIYLYLCYNLYIKLL